MPQHNSIKDNLTSTTFKNFASSNNELTIGGISLTHIEKLIGQTPFYAYNKELICKKIIFLQKNLPDNISLHYAIKANPYPSLVQLISPLVNGFDVASKKEMLLAIQSGMPAKNVSFAGPGKTVTDITAAIIAGVTLHVESINELNLTQKMAKQLGLLANIALRINPVFELKSSGMKMSGGAKPFGIDEELLPEILNRFPLEHVNLRGFHIFSGSQNLNNSAIIEAQQQSFTLAKKLLNLLSSTIKIDYINIGGGFGVPYFKNEVSLDIKPICDNLAELLAQYQVNFNGIEIIIELGRYLVADSGIYVTKVVDKKESRGTTYLVCDGGLHHHLANSGNFGQVIRRNFPVAIGNKLFCTTGGEKKGLSLEEVSIVGPLCTPLDILADKIMLPEANIGDYVVIFQSGAYGASASPKDFLSQPTLSELLL